MNNAATVFFERLLRLCSLPLTGPGVYDRLGAARCAVGEGTMPVFAVRRGWLLRGLTSGRTRWWALLVLAVAILGVTEGTAHAAAPTVSVTGVGTSTPVLRQVGSTWQTSVFVTDSSDCAQVKAIHYWLAALPYAAPAGKALLGPESPGTVAGATADGSACEVTVTFSGLAQVPATAVLVVNQSGTSAPVALTV